MHYLSIPSKTDFSEKISQNFSTGAIQLLGKGNQLAPQLKGLGETNSVASHSLRTSSSL